MAQPTGAAKATDLGLTYFYEKLEKDAVGRLLTDSDFGGGGTDAKGHVISGTYAFHKNWNFKATYFINKVDIAAGDNDKLRPPEAGPGFQIQIKPSTPGYLIGTALKRAGYPARFLNRSETYILDTYD